MTGRFEAGLQRRVIGALFSEAEKILELRESNCCSAADQRLKYPSLSRGHHTAQLIESTTLASSGLKLANDTRSLMKTCFNS
jgi:hypothetical protein